MTRWQEKDYSDVMYYPSILNLPSTIRNHLPEAAQKIYQETFNRTWQEYKNVESRNHTNLIPYDFAHEAALAAVAAKFPELNEVIKNISSLKSDNSSN